MKIPVIYYSLVAMLVFASHPTLAGERAWVHRGLEDFAKGQFEDGGSNLYVNANGVIEMIHRLDVNNDGYVDLVLANSHDYIERGPTHVYTHQDKGEGESWTRKEMSADSGWMSRIVDLDRDGHTDLVVANGENGVTSELPSFIYWGGPDGLGVERTDLRTTGAYDVAILDVNRDGILDLIFPTAWNDHHNPGKPMHARVYLGGENRQFTEATKKYEISGTAAVSIAAADLNKDGFVDLALANYRVEHEYNTESYIYWGTEGGFDTSEPVRLPTAYPLRVMLADLNHDNWDDVIFSGGNRVQIYWNREGKLDKDDTRSIEVTGYTSMFSSGAIGIDVADVTGDGLNDLLLAANKGVDIRSGIDLETVVQSLPLTHTDWVTAADLDGDGRKDLVVSRYDDNENYEVDSAVFWNSAEGFSIDRVTWFPTGGAVGSTAGDLDGDGRPEVVFNNTMGGHLSNIHNYIYLGNERAEYGVERRLEFPTDGSGMALVADVDLDGYPEFIAITGVQTETGWIPYVRIHPGGPNGPATDRFEDISANDGLQDIRLADFNRDGFLDILAFAQVYDTKPETLAKSSRIYFGSEAGYSISRSQVLETYGNAGNLADVNKDGFLDILCTDKRNEVLIYLGGTDGFDGDRTWHVPVPYPIATNTADLNADGWLDLIVSCAAHYHLHQDTMHVFYGSQNGYRSENSQKLLAGYTPIFTAIADFSRDGHLDVAATAYSTATSRVIPAQVFWGNGQTLDLDNPVNLPAEGSGDATQVDLNRDGWVDLVLASHRNDIGHQVDSLIYWNGPEGFLAAPATRLPGLGPHGMTARDRGNAYTREPDESYFSPPFDMKDLTAKRLHWKADVVPPAELKFQVRFAATKEKLSQNPWMGPQGPESFYERSGQKLKGSPRGAAWLQYRAVFVSPYACRSPQLQEVRVDFVPKH